jgi:hypothetical protein
MKTTLLLLSLSFCSLVFGQNLAKRIQPAVLSQDSPLRVASSKANKSHHGSTIANIACTDTLRYVLNKQASLFGTGWETNFATFACWRSDNEYFSQTFLQTGGSVTINKVEFYGSNDATNGTASVTVEASVYNVDASGVPTTLIGSGTLAITSATATYHYVTLSAPVTVTGNYAIVLRPTNTGSVLSVFVTNPDPGETMDGENLAHYRSTYYFASSGAWVNIPTLTNDFIDFPSGPYDFEPLISPIVSYNITSTLSASPNPLCLGNAVTLTSNAQPAGVLASRMYNFGAFLNHFNLQPDDSTYAWDMDDNSNLIWNTNTAPYTYAAAGTYNATMFVLGGFSNLCLDQATTAIVVNPIPSTAFSFSSGNTFCSTSTNPVPVAVNSGGTYSASLGLTLVSASTGEIDLALTPAGTYTLTYNPGGPCSPGTSHQVVTITQGANPSFSYASANYCSGSANVLPNFALGAVAGTFSSTTGLNFVSASTGEIDLTSSTAGTYTVTNEIAANGACPLISSNFVISVNPIPNVNSQTNQIVCNGSATTDILFTGNVSGTSYDWTNTDASIGIAVSGTSDILSFSAINTGSSPVTSVITVTPTAASCVGTATTFSITVNPNPIVAYTTLQATACVNDADIILSGATPSGGTYSGTAVTSGSFSPATAGAGTITITYSYIDGNNCSSSSSADIVVNALPIVDYSTLQSSACVTDVDIVLSGATPAGGTYSGTAVTLGSFSPTTAGAGTFPITYTYTDGNGCSSSSTASIIVDPCVGLKNITNDLFVELYPNPAINVLNVNLGNNVEQSEITIVTVDGKVVYHENIKDTKTAINVSSFARGLYFISITSNNKKFISKVVID